MSIAMMMSLTVEDCMAQKRNEFGIVAGDGYYLGDLNKGYQFVNNHVVFGAFYRRNFGHRLAVRLTTNYATISGNDSTTTITGRNVGYIPRQGSFESKILEAAITCEINYLEFIPGKSHNTWSPYVLLGAGAAYQLSLDGTFVGENPQNKYITNNEGVFTSGGDSLTTKPAVIAPNVCFGIGFKFAITERIGIFAEWTMHNTFVDWFDGFYYDQYDMNVENSKIRDLGHVRDASTTDWYSFLEAGVSFAFNFSNKNSCLDHLRK